ncbi:MAG: DUF1566 domain-containing protein [Desulfobulbaceae bacterium]|nr:DUF1566 domain-containing protein [Desulfobulbaceae bacterium]
MMKFISSFVLLSLMVCSANFASAQDKVVVIPFGGGGSAKAGVSKTGLNLSFSDCQYNLQVNVPGQTNVVFATDDGGTPQGNDLPTPRFTKNNDGTVTDNETKLVWLQDLSCANFTGVNLQSALENAKGLANGACNLTDGSQAGDWHIANIKELQSLLNWDYYSPRLSNAAGTGIWTDGDPFSNLPPAPYTIHSSTMFRSSSDYWGVVPLEFKEGLTKSGVGYALAATYWPVRTK